jgi:hypothetical protein
VRTVTFLVALALAGSAGAGDDPSPAAVKRAIDAGSAWLERELATDLATEKAAETDHEITELAVLTLTHTGANLQRKAYAEAVKKLEATTPRFTYRTALLAMALAEMNPRLYQAKIAHCAQWLVDTQLAGGEWGYPGTVDGAGRKPEGIVVDPPAPPEDAKEGDTRPKEKIVIRRRASRTGTAVEKGDFSNTQFAILGLRACRDAGIEVPKETWKAALEYLRKFQREEGGWGYVMQGEQDGASYASLTCAGTCSLAITLHALGSKDPKSDAGVKKALQWLDKNLDPTRNAGIENSSVLGPSRWQYYHLYSLERAGRVLGLSTVGKRDWYAEGASWILAAQKGDGRWSDETDDSSRPKYLTPADTCFALLFLARATRPITGS